jgi:hypothetical protein
MRRTIKVFALLVLLAGAWPSCAPVDEPAPGKAPASSDAVEKPVSEAVSPPPAAPAGLAERIETALRQVRERDLLTTHSFWTVFHGILGTGPEITLVDPETNRQVNAVDYICNGGVIRGLEFIPTRDGLDVRSGPQYVGQGHQDQFIAEMAQWGMPADRKFLVHGKEYHFSDFIRHAQARAQTNANQELSWAVLIIGQYLGTDVRWTNHVGQALHFEDLLRYELDQPIESAACGGTHRLFGLSWVYHLHLQKGRPVTGVWQEVAEKTERYQKIARKFQNPDGSFSTKYLSGPGNAPDPQLRIGSTGHVLEWLALALPSEELRASWMQEAANALALMILDSQGRPIEGGALYHAAHGLHIYHDRVFGPGPFKGARPLIPLPPEQLPAPRR